jgi:hypothetical protein
MSAGKQALPALPSGKDTAASSGVEEGKMF